jgi:hypothetical protein
MTYKARRVKVTQDHIDRATPEQSGRCMIAEAIKEMVPGAGKVHVDLQTIRFTDTEGIRRTYLTPGVAQAALVRYDAGDDVEPFAFNLPKPVHISTPTKQTKLSQATRKWQRKRASTETPPRIGGRPIPMLGNSTRRRFGIRGLRINQQGQVVQVHPDTPVEAAT